MLIVKSTLGLNNGDSIIAFVRAVNGQGASVRSNASNSNIVIQSAPTEYPLNLATTGLIEGTQVSLTWTPLTSTVGQGFITVLGYKIYSGTTMIKDISGLTSFTTTLTSLTGGTVYDLTINAYNVFGEGPNSPVLSFNTSTVPV
jgi:hypothetical protein